MIRYDLGINKWNAIESKGELFVSHGEGFNLNTLHIYIYTNNNWIYHKIKRVLSVIVLD